MKLSNFEIEDSIALRYANQYLDLHNDYDFTDFKYSVSSQIFEMSWTPIQSISTVTNPVTGLKLRFEEVDFLKIQERDNEMPYSEDTCIDIIGFLPQEMREVMDSFGAKPDYENDDMVFHFRGGQTIKIYAESVELILSVK
ncbi:hypothetical protein [Nibribacter koreensis]|uniref:Uncharacterized protein n=1 Tax=Nibribacter koreensis TaxID=1084519 RepID=A0ABP8F6A8_9BACT